MLDVGDFTATCSGAVDFADNAAADAVAHYHVDYGGVSGFQPPIKPDNTSVFNRGQAVAGKFSLAGDEPAGFDFSGWTFAKVSTNCTTLAGGAVSPVALLNAARYDAAADQYVLNADFRAEARRSCWQLRVTLDSGQSFDSAVFRLA